MVASKPFEPWVLVEKKFRWNLRSNGTINTKLQDKIKSGSYFNASSSLEYEGNKNEDLTSDLSGVIF